MKKKYLLFKYMIHFVAPLDGSSEGLPSRLSLSSRSDNGSEQLPKEHERKSW